MRHDGRTTDGIRRVAPDDRPKAWSTLDAVVLLTVPVDVLLQRLSERTTNDFGKDPVERERILRDLAEVELLGWAP